MSTATDDVGLRGGVLRLLHPHFSRFDFFGGSGTVLLQQPPVPVEVYNDRSERVYVLFKVLRSRTEREALIESLLYTPYSRSEVRACVDDPNLDDVERTRRYFVRVNAALAQSAARGDGGFLVTYRASRGSSRGTDWKLLISRLDQIADRFRMVQLENRCALDLLRRATSSPSPSDQRTAFFLDPPYLGRHVRYEVDDFGEDFHDQMLDLAMKHVGQVIIFGYDHPMYQRLDDAGWNRHLYSSSASGQPGEQVQRVDFVWSNRAVPDAPAPVPGRVCSEKCRKAVWRARRRAARPERRCEWCNEGFDAQASARFCSSRCKQSAYRDRLRSQAE